MNDDEEREKNEKKKLKALADTFFFYEKNLCDGKSYIKTAMIKRNAQVLETFNKCLRKQKKKRRKGLRVVFVFLSNKKAP